MYPQFQLHSFPQDFYPLAFIPQIFFSFSSSIRQSGHHYLTLPTEMTLSCFNPQCGFPVGFSK